MKRFVSCILALCLVVGMQGAAAALKAGAPMPEIGLKTLDGKSVTAESLKGKVVLVDFWATWCAPCKEEMPVLQKLHAKYGSKGLVVLGISVDRESDNIKSFLNKLGVSFPVAHDAEHEVAERFEPEKMPSSFIVDRKGTVKFVHAGFTAADAVKLENEVKGLL